MPSLSTAALRKQRDRALAAIGSLSGKRFALLVASSLVATTGIVAASLTTASGDGPLAALLGRSLAANTAPVESPAPEAGPVGGGGGGGSASASPSATGGSAPLGSSPAPEASSEPAPEPEGKTTPTVPSVEPPKTGQVKHVFMISLSSPGYEAAFGATTQMPYLASTLRPQGQLLEGYKLLGAAGLPNRIAATSGQPPNTDTKGNCSVYTEFPASAKLNTKGVVSGSGCIYPVETLNLGDQLSSGRYIWHGYFEGMVDAEGKPDTCVQPEVEGIDQPQPGAYAASRNPFVYFHSLLDVGDCTLNDLPLSEFEGHLSKEKTTPDFTYISPTACRAGSVGHCAPPAPGAPAPVEGAAAADAFLAEWVPKILASAAYKKDGLLIIAFDELAPEADPAAPVGALLLSKFVTKGATDPFEYSPYSLLKSIEELFGLSYLANARSVKVRSFGQFLRGGESVAGD